MADANARPAGHRHPELSEQRTDRVARVPARLLVRTNDAVLRWFKRQKAERLTRDRLALHLVAAGVTLLILAPLLAPGYVLSYDMVFVPHQALRWDLIAPSGALPRAVPQDAVVSLLTQVVPGWLLQRVALAGAIYAAALGAGRLVPATRLLTRVLAAIAYAWTPFLAERLLLGQWGLLLAYAALPWLVAAAKGIREGRPGAWARLIVAAAVSAITPTGGLIAVAVSAALVIGAPARRAAIAMGGVLALNGPWLAASLLTTAGGRSDAAGVDAFAARGENWSGALGALAGTGGSWNAQVAPGSRTSPLVPVATLVVVTLAVIGLPLLRRRWPSGYAMRLVLVAAGAFVVAALGAVPATAGGLRWMVANVPGAGLLRDGQKFLIPYVLVLVLGLALGTERIAQRLDPVLGRLVLVAVAVFSVALMPDLAFGGLGQLRPVSYPAEWDRVAAAIDQDPGPVLSLPMSLYRAYPWNHRRPVIDPAPRYLDQDVLVDDTLLVGSVAVQGEDRRAAFVRAAMDRGEPVSSSGVRWVLVARDSGGSVPPSALAGLRLVYNGQYMTLYENPEAALPTSPASSWQWGILVANLLALGLTGVAMWHLPRRATAW